MAISSAWLRLVLIDMILLDKYSLYCDAKLRHLMQKPLYHNGNSSQFAAKVLLILMKSSSMAIGLTIWELTGMDKWARSLWNSQLGLNQLGFQPASPDVKGLVRQGWEVDWAPTDLHNCPANGGVISTPPQIKLLSLVKSGCSGALKSGKQVLLELQS